MYTTHASASIRAIVYCECVRTRTHTHTHRHTRICACVYGCDVCVVCKAIVPAICIALVALPFNHTVCFITTAVGTVVV